MLIDSERAPVPAACGPGTAHDALTTGKGSAAEKNWSSGSETYKIGANERVGVDHCQVLCPWWRCVDCHCLTQRPWPFPPHSAIFGFLDRWWSHFRFEKASTLCYLWLTLVVTN